MKRVISILLLISIIASALTGCNKPKDPEKEPLTQGELCSMVCDEFGMYDFEQSEPYIESVTEESPYFEAVQKCVEWGIIDADNSDFDVNSEVTEAELAEILVNAGNLLGEEANTEDKIEFAIKNDLVGTRPDGTINANKSVTLGEAQTAVSAAQEMWANPNYDEYLDYKLKDGVTEISKEDIHYENGSLIVTADAASGLKEGSIYLAPDEYGFIGAYRVNVIQDTGNGSFVISNDDSLKLEDVVESLSYQESKDVDLSTAVITDWDGNVIHDGINGTSASNSYSEDPRLEFLDTSIQENQINSTGFLSSTKFSFKVNDLDVDVTVTDNSIAFGVKGEVEGVPISGEYKISDLEVDNKIDYSVFGGLKYARLCMDYETEQNMALSQSITYGKNMYNQKEDFDHLGTLIKDVAYTASKTGLNYDGNECKGSQKSYGILKLDIPGLSSSICGLRLEVKLDVTVKGTVKIVLTTSSKYGVEYQKKSGARIINKKSTDKKIDVKAQIEALLYVGLVAFCWKFNLADIGAKIGLGCSMSSTAHLADYNKAGELPVEVDACVTRLPGDFMEILSSVPLGGSRKIETCSDAKIYFILRGAIGSNSLLGNFIKIEREFFGEKNAVLIGLHLEDGRIVDSCTRKYRSEDPDDEEKEANEENAAGSTDPEKLDLTSYILTLRGQSQHLEIDLGEGETAPEVIWASADPKIATVDSTGLVSPVSTGITKVTVSLKSDPTVYVLCTIVVQEIGEENWQFLPADMAVRI